MKHRDTTVSVALGVLISVGVLLLLTGVSAKILISGRIGEESARWFVLLSLVIASILGCVVPLITRKADTAVTILVAAGNLALVTCCSLILDGPFESAWETLLAILFGGTISCVICMKKPVRNRKQKKHYR